MAIDKLNVENEGVDERLKYFTVTYGDSLFIWWINIDKFDMLNHPCISEIDHVDDLFDVYLDLVCQYFIEYFASMFMSEIGLSQFDCFPLSAPLGFCLDDLSISESGVLKSPTIHRTRTAALRTESRMCWLFWFLDPGGWSKTAVVRLYFIFPGICTLSLVFKMSNSDINLSYYNIWNTVYKLKTIVQIKYEIQQIKFKPNNMYTVMFSEINDSIDTLHLNDHI
ncbi:hypothetical protein STEG23_021455 [Scotinomys teguina]